MKVVGQMLGLLCGVVVIVAAGIGVKLVCRYVASRPIWLSASGIDSATILSFVVLLAAALIVARSIRSLRTQDRANQLHSEKEQTYRLFVDVHLAVLRRGAGRLDGAESELPEAGQTLDRLLMLYGSPAVIRAHAALRGLERQEGTPAPNLKSQFAKAMLAIRKDLGSKTVGLRADELLQLLIPESETISSTSEARDFNRDAVLVPSNSRS